MDSWFGLDTLSLRNKPDPMLKVSRQPRKCKARGWARAWRRRCALGGSRASGFDREKQDVSGACGGQ